MLSLGIFVVIVIGSIVESAALVTVAARLMGSARRQFRYGLLISLLAVAIGVVGQAVLAAPQLPKSNAAGMLIEWAAVFLLTQLALFLLIRLIFKLSLQRAAALYAAYLTAIVFWLILVVLVVRPYVLTAYVVPSESMAPTIQPGDRFVANKLLTPRRWDIVAYRTRESHIFCKRLIGLPGERLMFKGGDLYVNGAKVNAPAPIAGKMHARVNRVSLYEDGQTIQLGQEYFFVGDNLGVSVDSRMQGPRPRAALIGVVDLIYWPIRNARLVR